LSVDAQEIAERVRQAAALNQPLAIRGSGSKRFYGPAGAGEPLDVTSLSGIVDYEPAELVLIARAGTPLSELEARVAAERQMLAFEPPRFGGLGTLGGCVAAGLSGPRRPYAGAVRDFVLGTRLVNGKGEDLRFGGRVIKNVAGYDVSRLMAGAMGTLGVLLEVALKVLPRPPAEVTLRMEYGPAEALAALNRWAARPLPISGSCHSAGLLSIRLSGAESAVSAARRAIGGEPTSDGESFWAAIRDHTAPFFTSAPALWRVSLPPTAPPLTTSAPQLIEWNGALRWIASDAVGEALEREVAQVRGHLAPFRGGVGARPYPPLSDAMARMHRGLKSTFDPHGILNPGRAWFV
jgi:glycolate oxidase FAD binding subunit